MSRWHTHRVSETGAKRYPRTFNGLVASMIVCVVAVVGYWVLQNTTHSVQSIKPQAVDYAGTVKEIQAAGQSVIYPSSLPAGWKATDARYTPGDQPTWAIPMLTSSGTFAGLQVEQSPVLDVVHEYVDKNPHQGSIVTIPSAVADSWLEWSDSGGDHAFSATVGKDVVLVYGSASVADLRRLVGLLTTAPLG